jgi:hypothetical protein
LSNTEAVDLAFREGAIIQYDWKAQSPSLLTMIMLENSMLYGLKMHEA